MSRRKTARLGIRLSEADRVWIDEEVSRQDLESTSSYLRMLVRKARASSDPQRSDVQQLPQHEAA